ncbi:MAG: universal stress protein [Chloroflexi bacterium]|nr:universal stress protein [Chloroflexota bacterium]MCI0580239.1 universal stress protein [Chloroflexota bacterium]MCI0646900.1 universal stress protein [Chloroflexota bacterium]MCI0729095.1 universal stress protein [Chloroflexota bacterium]
MRILIPTGGAAHSNKAVRFGHDLAAAAGGTATILTVIKHESDRPRAEAILARAIELLAPAGFEVQTRIRVGQPADEIIQEARESKYDLMVMGERPEHNLITRVMGSTTERVITHAPCPIIVAKEKSGPIQHILVCDSGVENNSMVRRFTRRMAELLGENVKVTLLHVMSQMSAGPGVTNGQDLSATAEELIQEHSPEGQILKRDLAILQQAQTQVHPKVRHGLVVEEILAEARSGNYDLIVIGAHCGERWQRFLLDDLARQIVIHADRPVLVIP